MAGILTKAEFVERKVYAKEKPTMSLPDIRYLRSVTWVSFKNGRNL